MPDPAPERATGRGRAWYRGDMHLHTVHSDGTYQPADVAAGARAAGLDFIASTDHNTSSAAAVRGAYAGPDLLIVDGEEITTRNGHWLAVGLPAGAWIDRRYRATDGSFAEFRRAGAPARRSGDRRPSVLPVRRLLVEVRVRRLDAVEVWNGPWTVDDEVSVSTWDGLLVEDGRSARWLPAVDNSDAHRPGQVVGRPQTAVLARGLDTRSIVDGVRAGRSWIAGSAAVQLSFAGTAAGRTAGIGERLAVPDGMAVTATVTVSGAPGGVVRLVTDEGQVALTPMDASGAGTVPWITTPRRRRTSGPRYAVPTRRRASGRDGGDDQPDLPRPYPTLR